jgi:hypothetical protein
MSGPMDDEQPSSWRATFLAALEASGNVSAAARRAALHRGTAYRHRAADPSFRAAWDEALEVALDDLEAEARRRAVDGWDEPVFHAGVVCGHIRKYSDALIMFLMKAYRPEFRDHARVEPSGDTTVRVVYANDWRDSPADSWHRSPAEQLPAWGPTRPALPSPSHGPGETSADVGDAS